MSLWRDRDFTAFWLGEMISSVGTQVTFLALPLAALVTLDVDTAGMGVLRFAEYLPFLAFTLLFGVWADRHRLRPNHNSDTVVPTASPTRPTEVIAMIVNVDRYSVAMGDDIRSHAQTIDLPPETSLADVVAYLLERHFLAAIAGGKATWILVADRPLAVIAQQWDAPRYLVDPSLPISSFNTDGQGVSLMFRYWRQRDPDDVFAELAAGREPER